MRSQDLFGALAFMLAIALSVEAQQTPEAPADACQQALDGLGYARDGYNKPRGVAASGSARMKFDNGYRWSSEQQEFLVDGFIEYGAVRAACPAAKLPAEAKPEGLKAGILAAVQRKEIFCGDPAVSDRYATRVIEAHSKSADRVGFEDRRMELRGELKDWDAAHLPAATRAAGALWLRDVARELAAACTPNDHAKNALAAAEDAVKITKENVDFLACVKAREAIQPQIQAFDAAAKTADIPQMKSALAALGTAAQPVKAACAPSVEGLSETNYIIASKRMQILFPEIPGCRDAAAAMNQIRQQMTAMGKDELPTAIAALSQQAKAARGACNNDPAPETWGNFVAWITERNLTRLP